MKNKFIHIIAGAALALGIFAAPTPADAATAYTGTLPITYCWGKTTFGTGGCKVGWPTTNIKLIGTTSSGNAIQRYGSTAAFTGTYTFGANQNSIGLEWLAPAASIVKVTYTGATYPGAAPGCFRGTMVSDKLVDPDFTGVWFGCLQP